MAGKKGVRKYYKREFLNSKHGMAAMIVRASVSEEYCSGSLNLSDCSNQISLDFDAENVKDIPDRLRKIERIRRGLDAIEDVLLEGLVRMITPEEWDEIKAAREAAGEDRPYINRYYDDL